MHRLPNRYAVARFRFAALLLLGKWALVTGSAVMLAYSLCVANPRGTQLSVGLIWCAVGISVLQWLLAGRARCPLCVGHPLAHETCATHRSIRPLFGSHQMRVAISVVFKGWFRCPYCGEPTAIAARHPHH